MKKVLIVDDDLALRTGLGARLRANGLNAVFAADGASAVQIARRENPDLILLDIGLPGGDGFLVMKRLRQLMSVACIPIFIITALPVEPNRQKALDGGANGFFQKPVDNGQLLAAINEALGATASSFS